MFEKTKHYIKYIVVLLRVTFKHFSRSVMKRGNILWHLSGYICKLIIMYSNMDVPNRGFSPLWLGRDSEILPHFFTFDPQHWIRSAWSGHQFRAVYFGGREPLNLFGQFWKLGWGRRSNQLTVRNLNQFEPLTCFHYTTGYFMHKSYPPINSSMFSQSNDGFLSTLLNVIKWSWHDRLDFSFYF